MVTGLQLCRWLMTRRATGTISHWSTDAATLTADFE